MSNDFRTTVSSVGIFAALHPGRLKLWDTIDRVEEAEKSNTANLHTRPYQHNASPSKQGEETSFEHEHDKRHPPPIPECNQDGYIRSKACIWKQTQPGVMDHGC